MPESVKVFLAHFLVCLTIFLSVAGILLPGTPVMAQSAPSANAPALAKLEKKFFEHSYSSDSDDDRIGRLEKLIFGETKTGDVASRLADIQKIVSTNDISAGGGDNSASASGSSASGQSASNANSSASGSSNSSSSTASSAAIPGASYPRVDALEQLLLGQTYKTTSLEKRLGQLEKKAFGRTSNNDDMSARTDALEQYWQKSLSPALNQKYDTALSQLETQVIGQSYPAKPIIERLQTLEGIVFPNDPPDTHSPIKDQLETLANAVQISQKQGRRPSASAAGDPGQGQSPPQAAYQSQQQAPSNAPGQYGSYGQTNPYSSGTTTTGSYGSQLGYGSAASTPNGTGTGSYGAQTGYANTASANTEQPYPGQPAANSYTSNGQYTTSQATTPPTNYGQITPFANSAANNESYSGTGSSNGQSGQGGEPNKGHPLLKGLAKALGAAAGMAAGAMGSGMMYGGGMGGYGYGGNPMGGYGGYGGYPMGGYGGYGGYGGMGGYPMGGMGGININGIGTGGMGRWW